MQPTRSEIIAWAARAIACAEEHLELGDVIEACAMYENARGWLATEPRPAGSEWTSGQLVIKRWLACAVEAGLNGLPDPRTPRWGGLR